MAIRKLSKSFVDKIVPTEVDLVIWDEDLPGFGIRTKPSGVMSYIVQYRDRQTGESRRKTLGRHGPLLSFHKAREQAQILLAGAMQGRDPIGEGNAHRAAITLREMKMYMSFRAMCPEDH